MYSIIAVTNKHTAKLHHVGSLYILTYDARKIKHKIHCMKLIIKYFFLGYFLGGGGRGVFGGVFLVLDKYIFLWQTFYFGGCSRLELSCIWVSTVCEEN
jgi:hypothetical protein